MRVEILYVPGCPNHAPALSRLRDTLRTESLDIRVQEIAVTDEAAARSLSFPGSPTIRVNGLDVEHAEKLPVGLACRLYRNGTGVPSTETLQQAIASAKQAEQNA
jgi:hypothetical protein